LKGEIDMEYQIVGRGIEVTPAMRSAAIKKISYFEKYFNSDYPVRCVVTFSVGHLDQTVEINIHSKETDLRAKVLASDAYEAIDLAMAKLEKQMRKMKTQLINAKSKKNSLAEDMRLDMLEEDRSEDEDINKIVKKKKILLTPMDTSEALARMEALDHSFFIYIDSTTQKRCVLYKREEGDFGLIELDE
jgi:putative sigma-54 modulation protein